jgi:hypothetical protein
LLGLDSISLGSSLNLWRISWLTFRQIFCFKIKSSKKLCLGIRCSFLESFQRRQIWKGYGFHGSLFSKILRFVNLLLFEIFEFFKSLMIEDFDFSFILFSNQFNSQSYIVFWNFFDDSLLHTLRKLKVALNTSSLDDTDRKSHTVHFIIVNYIKSLFVHKT